MTRYYLPLFILTFLLLYSSGDVKAQAYNECGYGGPSSPSTEPLAPINPAYTQAGPVVCADGSFPECSTPLDANGGSDFAGNCGSPSFDFILTDPASVATTDGGPAIIGVSPDGVVDPSALGLAVGDDVCATGFCYDFPQIVNLINQINGSTSACSALEDQAGVPVCPITVPTDLNDLFTIAGTITGGGDLSVGDVVATLPQLLALNDIPNETFDVPVCGLISGADANVADYCMEVVDCSVDGSPCELPACPAVTSVTTTSGNVCDGDVVTVCVDFDAAADDVTVNGVAVATAGDTQICYDVNAANATCAWVTETSTPDVQCQGGPLAAADASWFTYPVYTVVEDLPVCDGAAGSATIQAGGVDCNTVAGVAGTSNVCPATADTDGTLDYDFGAILGIPQSLADALPCVGTLTSTLAVDCEVVCVCPVVTAITPGATEACSGDVINVCIDFDVVVDATITVDVNGVAGDGTAGGTQICVDVPTDNQTCDPVPLPYVVSAACAGVAIDVSGFVLTDAQVYPLLEETITPPDCAAEAGSAVLAVAGGGVECQNIAGTLGVPNVCPDTNDTDATLTYDFTAFNTPCFTGTMGIAPVDCAVVCVCPVVTAITPGATEACSGDVINVCIDFDVAVDATITIDVNGVAGDGTAGGTQICVDVPTDNQTCDPVPLPYVVSAACAGVAIDVSGFVLVDAQVYPLLEETIIPPTCGIFGDVGDPGVAILAVAGGGVQCESISGTGGIPYTCDDPNGINGELFYDFTTYNSACFTGTTDIITIDCALPCDVDLVLTDPCNCDIGIDTDGNPANGNELAAETVTVTAGVGPFQVTDATGLLDASGNPLIGDDGVNPVSVANPLTLAGNTVTGIYVPADNTATYTITVVGADGGTGTLIGGPCPICTVAAACTVDAGEPTPATADVCDTDLAAVDVTAVFADPGVAGTPSLNQNYVIVDPANANDIISVSNTAVLDLTGLAVGDQACVTSVAYTQETLDIVTAFVDAQLGSVCVPITGPCASDFLGPFGTLDLAGFLNSLNGAFEGFGFNFTSDDIALWCINQEITLPLSALPGGLLPDLVIDLTTIPGLEPDGFCCDFSTDTHCLTVISCNACAIAPIADPAAPVVTTESTCEVDGVTLSGGVIDYTGTTCPTGATLEYSTDGGTTWVTAAPTYDQTTAITVTVRCLCDEDGVTASGTAEVTTVPGVCATANDCTALAGEAAAGAPTEVCNDAAEPVDADILFDPASGGYDSDGDGVVDANVSTNYIAVDVNGNIIAVTAAGSTTLDLSALADGETACIYQLAYTQGTLDAVTGFLDNLLCSTLCVDVPLVGTTCLGDVGYCPGVTPVELAPFLDLLNQFFGFNETQICNFIDNQILTITDPTGIIGDQQIDLVALGIDFCVDKSEVYCVTANSGVCVGTSVCAADAPTMSIDCTLCPDGVTTGGPCTVTDAGDGSANAGEITEYLVIDDAAGTATGTVDGIMSVGALADAQVAVDTLGDGNEVCVTAITHIQTELDAVIAAINAGLAPLGVDLGLPAAGNTLAGVFGAIQALGGGATVDLATIEAIIANGAGGQVDLGAVLGLPPGLVVVDLPTFCYDVDPAVCVTGNTCMGGGICEISVDITNVVCNDGGTPDDPADDTVTFDYTVTDIGGTGTTWSSDQGDAGVAYGTVVSAGPVPADGTTWTITVNDDADMLCTDSKGQVLTNCTPSSTDIPTLSEWGLITLALLLMTFGSVKMAVGSVAMNGMGSSNIPVPGMSNLQLPFDAGILRKAFTFIGILAMIGFVICFAIYGTIFLPDVIGVLVAGPVLAYLAHLLYILETRKEK